MLLHLTTTKHTIQIPKYIINIEVQFYFSMTILALILELSTTVLVAFSFILEYFSQFVPMSSYFSTFPYLPPPPPHWEISLPLSQPEPVPQFPFSEKDDSVGHKGESAPSLTSLPPTPAEVSALDLQCWIFGEVGLF